MFSILDILKKHREDKKRTAAPVTGSLIHDIISERAADPPASSGATGQVSVFSAVNKELIEENMRSMARFYEEAVALAAKLYSPEGPDPDLVKSGLDPLLVSLVGLLSKGEQEYLSFFLAEYPDAVDYLPRHAANVSLLSVEFGLALGYEANVLADLAKAAFLHDIGMASLTEIRLKNAKLTGEELDKVRRHPKLGAEIIARIGREYPHLVLEVLLQEHERQDGSGYPLGLKSDDISEFAQIVGLADVYEALVHKRPYRGRHTPSEAANLILNAKSSFSPRLVKVLIERVGIFPAGTKVRLSTKETAVVVKINPLSPLRPVVNVIADARGNELKSGKEINLYKNYLVYIEESYGR